MTATLVATLADVAVEWSERHNTSNYGISGILQAGAALVKVSEACRHLSGCVLMNSVGRAHRVLKPMNEDADCLQIPHQHDISNSFLFVRVKSSK
jgi:hypothetical protein